MATFDDYLIEQVKKYPAIYNFKKNYHSKSVNQLEYMVLKEKCWKDIATELERTPEECKTRWRNIRDTYRKVIKRNILVSKYTHDDRLKFLELDDEASSSREGENGDNTSTDVTSTNITGIRNNDSRQDYEMNEDSQNSVGGNTQQFILQETNATRETDTIVIKTEPNECLISIDPIYPEEENIEKKKPSKRRRAARKAQDIDVGKSATHKFFSSMADIVSEFPPDKVAEMRMQICNMVSEMELAILTNQSQAAIVGYESSSSL